MVAGGGGACVTAALPKESRVRVGWEYENARRVWPSEGQVGKPSACSQRGKDASEITMRCLQTSVMSWTELKRKFRNSDADINKSGGQREPRAPRRV